MSGTAQFVTLGGIRIQNFWNQTAPYSFEGAGYTFVPFVYKGASVEVGGENSEAYLAMSSTDMTLGLLGRSVLNQPLTIISVWLTNELQIASYAPRRDTLLINAVAYNEERVEIRLRSAVDAAVARFPNRRMTSQLVGNLPRDGQVRLA